MLNEKGYSTTMQYNNYSIFAIILTSWWKKFILFRLCLLKEVGNISLQRASETSNHWRIFCEEYSYSLTKHSKLFHILKSSCNFLVSNFSQECVHLLKRKRRAHSLLHKNVCISHVSMQQEKYVNPLYIHDGAILNVRIYHKR